MESILPAPTRMLYNLGTAYAHAGQPGWAVWRYLQALQIQPRDRDLRQNLAALAPQLNEDLGVTPIPPVNRLYLLLSGNEWTLIAGGFTALALALIALSYWFLRGGRPRRMLRIAAGALALAALICWPPAITHYYLEQVIDQGVIVGPEVVARIGPSEAAYSSFGLEPGRVVKVVDNPQPGWLKISLGGKAGYVQHRDVQFL